MNEYYMELSLLFGLTHTKQNLVPSHNEDLFIDSMLSTRSEFLQNIQKFLRFLVNGSDIKAVCINFKLSPSLLLLITQINQNTKYCLVCCNYWERLEDHLRISHNLTKDYTLIKRQSMLESLTEQKTTKNSADVKMVDHYIDLTSKSSEDQDEKMIKAGRCSEGFKAAEGVVEGSEDRQGGWGLMGNKKNKGCQTSVLSSLADEYSSKIAGKDYFGFVPNSVGIGEKDLGVGNDAGKGLVKETATVCEICKVPLEKTEYKRHMRAHIGNSLQNCPVCGKEVRRRYMRKHKCMKLNN